MPRRPTHQSDVSERDPSRPCSAAILVYLAFTVKVLNASMSKRSSISTTQYIMLISLIRGGDHLRVKEVADILSINHSTVSVQAAKLKEAGYLSYKTSEDDNRGMELHITKAGKEIVDRTDKIVAEAINTVWQPLSSAQRRGMLKSALSAVGKNRRRQENGMHRADTAYAEGILMSIRAF